MDKISKALKKLTGKEKTILIGILSDIKAGKFSGMDIKKLKKRGDIFRIRHGKMRIIYRVDSDHKIFILTIERRSDNTYK